MADTNPGKTQSSEALDAVLNKGGADAEQIRDKFHRTMLWRLRSGKRSPELQTAVDIEKITGGKVTAEGWTLKIECAPESALNELGSKRGAA
jgi:hypothetical protein